MEVLAGPGDEVVVEVLGGGGPARVLSLHDGDQVLSDIVDLIPSEQVRNLTTGQHVVHVL